ncbi:Mov34/MPN/PAD-1 family protein [Oceanisphaera sp. KMM 10153]|uniref:Mov34/MPN/PAD-1 family protein n=1 Tax=Oceanisphaera submarina TaxID=3390193 RepID=UPI0039768B7F
MFEQYHEQITAEALAGYPLECVWLITVSDCRQVANVADEPEKTFRIAKRDLLKAQKEGLLAVVHSHPNYPDCPSEADMRGQINTGVPWGIIATDGTGCTPIAWWGKGVDVPPLVGRGFRHGITDCYALIRDYYRTERGVTLPEYPRNWEWWLNGDDLYGEGFRSAGFVPIDARQAQPGDVWIAQVRSPVPNHGGVLLERGLALHHPCASNPVDPTRLSVREPIARWLPHIALWLRYEGDA